MGEPVEEHRKPLIKHARGSMPRAGPRIGPPKRHESGRDLRPRSLDLRDSRGPYISRSGQDPLGARTQAGRLDDSACPPGVG